MKRFIAECRRRQVFRVTGLYVVGSWIVLQVAALAFENWGIPVEAMRFVWTGAFVGFPVALLLGWRFNVTGGRIVVTAKTEDVDDQPLGRADFAILGVAATAVMIVTAGLMVGIQRVEPVHEQSHKAAEPEPYSIAVLPCTDMSPDGDQAYFAEGIAEELLNLLAKYSGLRVTSRSSSFALPVAELSVPEMAQKLRVAHLLECSVRKSGNRIRLTAQLIDGVSDRHEWSETYERDLDDVFALQDEISRKVVREMKVRLLGPAPSPEITDSGAYDLYLQALSLLASRGDANLLQAENLFERVIDLDPTYAPAHASLALTLVWQPGNAPASVRRAEVAADQALALDPNNSDALTALGFLMGDVHGQVEKARELFQRAIESNPNNATAHRWLARSYSNDEPRRYYALIRQAYSVDPLDPTIHFHLAVSAQSLALYAEALAAARQLPVDNGGSLGHVLATNIHQYTGRLDKAVKSGYHAYRVKPDGWTYAAIFWPLANMGELDLAEAWIEEVKRQTGWSYVEPDEAVLAFKSGNADQAVALQIAAFERGEIDEIMLAHWILIFARDFQRARELTESRFMRLDHDPLRFDPSLPWQMYIDYALDLQQTGNSEHAADLIRDIQLSVDAQLSRGVLSTDLDGPRVLQAQLYAMSGNSTEAIESLRGLFEDGFSEVGYLRASPYFDNLRSDPEFISLVAEMGRRVEAQRQQLANEGMLLTPQEVATLHSFDFDPFVR